jgi:hypothetical protein
MINGTTSQASHLAVVDGATVQMSDMVTSAIPDTAATRRIAEDKTRPFKTMSSYTCPPSGDPSKGVHGNIASTSHVVVNGDHTVPPPTQQGSVEGGGPSLQRDPRLTSIPGDILGGRILQQLQPEISQFNASSLMSYVLISSLTYWQLPPSRPICHLFQIEKANVKSTVYTSTRIQEGLHRYFLIVILHFFADAYAEIFSAFIRTIIRNRKASRNRT